MSEAIQNPVESGPVENHNAPVLSITTGRPVDPAVAERRRQDRELADAILAGDADAFTRLHELYSQRLYRFAVKWGIGARLGRATLRRIEHVLLFGFLGLGLLTLVVLAGWIEPPLAFLLGD